jgi:hypothetical protein
MPKGAPEKLALAEWTQRRTSVSLRCVSKRLEKGKTTRVLPLAAQWRNFVSHPIVTALPPRNL